MLIKTINNPILLLFIDYFLYTLQKVESIDNCTSFSSNFRITENVATVLGKKPPTINPTRVKKIHSTFIYIILKIQLNRV